MAHPTNDIYCNLQLKTATLFIGIRKSTIGSLVVEGKTMIGRTLKYVIVALAVLMSFAKVAGCPTCIGKLRLGVKKPFFEFYRPHSRSIYAKKRDLLRKKLSYKKTVPPMLKNDPKRPAKNTEGI